VAAKSPVAGSLARKALFALLSVAVLAAPFGILPTGWNRGFGTLCLRESLVYGFSLLGYYWAFSVLAGWAWRRIGTDPAKDRFPAFMTFGVIIAVVYTWMMTNWDWDMRYLWSACSAG
jgi:hypothetical protein